MINRSPFKYFKTSPEIIRLAVMLYVRFPLSLRNVEDPLHERGVDVNHETLVHPIRTDDPLGSKRICIGDFLIDAPR